MPQDDLKLEPILAHHQGAQISSNIIVVNNETETCTYRTTEQNYRPVNANNNIAGV